MSKSTATSFPPGVLYAPCIETSAAVAHRGEGAQAPSAARATASRGGDLGGLRRRRLDYTQRALPIVGIEHMCYSTCARIIASTAPHGGDANPPPPPFSPPFPL